jgi:periplasmic copper chaperone A
MAIGKFLGYPALVLLLLAALATGYLMISDKGTAYANIGVENAVLRPPVRGQTTASAYFDITNTGGANQLLSVSSPISEKVEIYTHLNEDGMMKMRRVESVKILPKQTTKFKRMGLHVMVFNADIPTGAKQIPLTLTFARSPVYVKVERDDQGKKIDIPKVFTVTVLAEVEG